MATYKGFTYEVEQDEDPDSPADWMDEEGLVLWKQSRRRGVALQIGADSVEDAVDVTHYCMDAGYECYGVGCGETSVWVIGSEPIDVAQDGWDNDFYGVVLLKKRDPVEQFATGKLQSDRVKEILRPWNAYLQGEVCTFRVMGGDGEILESGCGIYCDSEKSARRWAEEAAQEAIDALEGATRKLTYLVYGETETRVTEVPVEMSTYTALQQAAEKHGKAVVAYDHFVRAAVSCG